MADFDPSSGLLLTNPRTGAQVAAWLNELAAFLMSTGYGGAVPTHAEAGHIWSKNTGGAPDPMMFDGASSFQLYTALNAIGAVSGDGAGKNTGAIVDIGFTGGSYWVKFVGGLGVCLRRLTNHPAGTEVWSLPITFTDTAKMFAFGTVNYLANARIVSLSATAVDEVSAAIWSYDNTFQSTFAQAICFGFWTEEFL